MLSTSEWKSIDSNDKSWKSTNLRLFGAFVLLLIGAVLYFSLGYDRSSNVEHSMFVTQNEVNEAPTYPTKEELEEYRSKTVRITYDIQELPDSDYPLEPDSEIMLKFHDDLVLKRGYNWDEYNIQFKVADKVSLSDDVDSLSCSSHYAYFYSSGFLEVTCDSDEVPTGCISYEPYTSGYRWGETGYYTSQCYTNGYDTQFTRIDVRCCQSDVGTATLSTSYSSNYASSSSDYCVYEECDSGAVAIGCTVSDSSSYTTGFSGTQRTERDYSTFEYSGCKGQRSDVGYLWVAPYCASLTSGTLDCYTVEGTQNELYSVVTCDDDAYVLTDCSAQIYNDINACTAASAAIDWGVNYGGWMYGDYCAAKGEPNIIAQATCCKIQ